MCYQLKPFHQLSTEELFEIYRVRTEVFVVEQHCAYQEVDEKDKIAWHLFLQEKEKVIAYCRIIPPPHRLAIGRVLVAKSARGKGLAHQLMKQALDFCQQQWQGIPIYIQAQTYLEPFYQGLGFHPISDSYLEDGIPHLDMEWKNDER